MKKFIIIALLIFIPTIVFAFTYEWEIDFMEYANDAAAQLAYVTDGTYGIDVCGGGTASADTIYNATYSADKACDDLANTAWSTTDVAYPHWWKYDLGEGNEKTVNKYTIQARDTSGETAAKDFKLQGSNNDSDWTDLDIQTGETYTNGQKKTYTGLSEGVNTTAYRYYRFLGTSNNSGATPNYMQIAEYEMMELSLQSYSEDTIKEQGTYSLKVVAVITDSLNDTLTKTLTDYKDLSNCEGIEYDIYALRTGSNIKIGIHDSGGTTSEHTANVSSSNVNQTESWDISGIADANKDDIDSIIITIVNADAANTFYIDDMKAGITPAAGGGGYMVIF